MFNNYNYEDIYELNLTSFTTYLYNKMVKFCYPEDINIFNLEENKKNEIYKNLSKCINLKKLTINDNSNSLYNNNTDNFLIKALRQLFNLTEITITIRKLIDLAPYLNKIRKITIINKKDDINMPKCIYDLINLEELVVQGTYFIADEDISKLQKLKSIENVVLHNEVAKMLRIRKISLNSKANVYVKDYYKSGEYLLFVKHIDDYIEELQELLKDVKYLTIINPTQQFIDNLPNTIEYISIIGETKMWFSSQDHKHFEFAQIKMLNLPISLKELIINSDYDDTNYHVSYGCAIKKM